MIVSGNISKEFIEISVDFIDCSLAFGILISLDNKKLLYVPPFHF